MTGQPTGERARRIEAFLAEAGWAGAVAHSLAGDASARRFTRLRDGHGRSVVLMEAPPPREDVRPFVRIAHHLVGLGLSAPRLVAADETAGLVLLEDFGDDSFARLLDGGAPARGTRASWRDAGGGAATRAAPARGTRASWRDAGGGAATRAAPAQSLYALATDLLIALHRHPAAAAVEAPAFDEAAMAAQPDLLIEWYLPAVSGEAATAELQVAHRALWLGLVPLARRVPDSLVLRDYFPGNLMLLQGRPGVAACGLLDFQDALIGSRAYDLASLLEDARRDVPGPLATAMVARYLAAFPELDPAAFRDAYALCAALRNCRILGLFTRLARRDGKVEYLRHVPRLWRLIERQLAHPALAPLAAWLAEHIPPAERRIPRPPA